MTIIECFACEGEGVVPCKARCGNNVMLSKAAMHDHICPQCSGVGRVLKDAHLPGFDVERGDISPMGVVIPLERARLVSYKRHVRHG